MSKKGAEIKDAENFVGDAEKDFDVTKKVEREGRFDRLHLLKSIKDDLNEKGERLKEQNEEETAKIIIDRMASSDLNYRVAIFTVTEDALSLQYDEKSENVDTFKKQISDLKKVAKDRKKEFGWVEFGEDSHVKSRVSKFIKTLEAIELYMNAFNKMSNKERKGLDNPKREGPLDRHQQKFLKQKLALKNKLKDVQKELEVYWKKQEKRNEKEGKEPKSEKESLQDNVIPFASADKKKKEKAIQKETPEESGDSDMAA